MVTPYFLKIFEGFGIKFHFVDMTDVSNISDHVNNQTKLIWVETPTNPMMSIIDIAAVAKIAKEAKALLMFAFSNNVLESVKIPELKQRITKIIANKLGVNIGFDL